MRAGRGRLAAPRPARSVPSGRLYFTTSNGRIMSFSSCSRMWQW